MGSEGTIEVPKALLDVDVTKFGRGTIRLDSNKTFDQNLRDNFGITADQAASILKFSLKAGIPVTPPPPVGEPVELSGGKRRRMRHRGGVGWVQAAVGLAGTAMTTFQNAAYIANQVSSVVTFVDQASSKFVDTSKLRASRDVWNEAMKTHCPLVTSVPTSCPGGVSGLKCKVWDYEEVGSKLGVYNVHKQLCDLATTEYNTAVSQLGEAENNALDALGTSLTGIVDVINVASMPTVDFDRLVNEKVLSAEGKITDPKKYKEYTDSRISSLTTIPPLPSPSPAAAQFVGKSEPAPKEGPASRAPAPPNTRIGKDGKPKAGGSRRYRATKKRSVKRRSTRRHKAFMHLSSPVFTY